MQFVCKHFKDLSLEELYEIGRLRQEVFVLEQNCPYVDFDGKDQYCFHMMVLDQDGQLQAYSRLVPQGISYPEDISIGRVVNSKAVRGTGIGRLLMEKSGPNDDTSCSQTRCSRRDIEARVFAAPPNAVLKIPPEFSGLP